MSGGSMNYLYSLVGEANFATDTPERKAFKEHLKLVAAALHDIEWVDSNDCGAGEENESIRNCIGNSKPIESAIDDTYKAIANMICELERLKALNESDVPR